MKKIKNFVFDFGGVLYEIAPQRTLNALSEKSETPLGNNILKHFYTTLVIPYEKSILSSLQFYKESRKLLQLNISFADFQKIWNGTLIGLYHDSVQLVSEIVKHSRAILLSNTNSVHYRHFEPECTFLFSLFERCFFSFRVGMTKPEEQFFSYMLSETGFSPDETLFIDDSQDNCEAARRMGIRYINLTDRKMLSELLHTVR